MAKYSSSVHYNIKTTLDASGITKLQSGIHRVQGELRRLNTLEMIGGKQYNEAMTKINTLSSALQKAFNPKLGMLNFGAFQKELKGANTSIADIGKSFKAAGSVGDQELNNLIGRLGKIDTGLSTTSKTADKIFNTIGNTVRWGVIASGFQSILNSTHQAVQYMKDLDVSLTNIRMVTDYSKEDMREFAQYANDAAQALSSTTVAYTNASLIFAQQGYSLPEATQLGEYSIKLANVTGQDTNVTSNQLTSYMNAYQTDIEDIGLALDKWAEVANVSAADVKELSVATQKAGSTASTVGVNMDQLAAQIATIESVTRDAPENIGNGLKTIYARFSDLSLGETLEDGMDLGKVSSTLEGMGVEVLDKETGVMNDVGDIIEQLMGVWDGLDQGQKAAAANTLAGKYQMNRLMALMENSDMYESYKASSEGAEGTLDEMQSEYAESLQGRTKALVASLEELITTVFNQDSLGPFLDRLKEIINTIDDLFTAIGGGETVLTGLGMLAMSVFSKQIGQSAVNAYNTIQKKQVQMANSEGAGSRVLKQMGADSRIATDSKHAGVLNLAQQGHDLAPHMSTEQIDRYNASLQETINLTNKAIASSDQYEMQIKATNIAYAQAGGLSFGDFIRKGSDGTYDQAATKLYKDYDPLNAESLKSATTVFDQMEDKTASLSQKIVRLDDTFQEGRADITGYVQAIDKIKNELNGLPQSVLKSDRSFEKLGAELDKVKIALQVNGKATGEEKKRIEDLTQVIIRLQQEYKEMAALGSKAPLNSGKAYTNATGQVKDNQDIADEQRKQTQGELDSVAAQKRVAAFSELTSTIMSLAFAWQSFQALGSIWANEDLETGDKIGQTIMNLGMSLPMLVLAFVQLKTAMADLPALQTMATQLKGLDFSMRGLGASAAGTGTTFGTILTGGFRAAGVAAKGVTIAVGGLIKAFAPFLVITAAISAVSAAVSFFSEKSKQKIEEIATKGEDAVKSLNALTNEVPTYNKLYKEYQKTGVVTNELIESTKKLAEAFGVTIDTDLLKAGSIETVNEALQKQIELQEISAAQNARISLDQIASENKGPVGSEYRSSTQVGGIRTGDAQTETAVFQSGVEAEMVQMDNTGVLAMGGFSADSSFEEQVGIIKDAQVLLTSARQEYELLLAGVDQDSAEAETYEAAIKEIEDYNTQLSGYFDADAVKQYEEQLGALANREAAKIAEEIDVSSDTIQDARKKLLANEDINDYYTLMGTEGGEAYIDGLLAGMGYDSRAVEDKVKSILSTGFDASSVKGVAENQDSLEELVSSYKEKGSFTTDEVAELLAEHPEYAQYLTQVGDSYKLNELALKDWNQALKDQKDTLDELFDTSFKQLEDSNSYFNDITTSKIDIDATEKTDAQTLNLKSSAEEIAELNSNLADGAIDVQEYSSKLGEAVNQLNNISDLGEIDFSLLDEQEVKDLESYLTGITESVTAALTQLSKQFHRGEISLNDYLTGIADLSEASIETEAALEGLTKKNGKWVDSTEDGTDGTENEADAFNKLQDGVDSLQALSPVLDIFANKNEELRKFFTDKGVIDLQAVNNDVEGYNNLMSNLGASAAEVFKNNEALVSKFKAQLVKNHAMTGEQLRNLNVTNAQSLTNLITTNKQAASALLQTMLKEAEGSVALATAGITKMLEGVETLLSSFSVKINATPTVDPKGGEVLDIQGTGVLGSMADKIFGTVTLPSFSYEVSTSDAEISNKNKIATSFAEGGVGISSVFGDNGADLSDWASNSNGAADASQFTGTDPDTGGSGSSKGGSGKSKKDKQKKDLIEKEVDLYKKVNHQLEAISNKYEKISNEADRLTGKDRQKAWQKELDLLDQQIDKLKEKQRIQQREMEGTANKPNSGLRDKLKNNYGLRFGPDGEMLNYNIRRNALVDQANAAIRRYNANNSEANEKAVEQAQKRLEAFDEAVDRYETLWADMQETNQEIEDAADAAEDLRVEILQAAVEAADSIKELNESLDDLEGRLTGFSLGDMDDPFVGMHTSADKLIDYLDRSFVNDLQGVMPGIDVWGPNMDYDSVDGKGHGRLTDAANYAAFVQQEMDKQARGEKNVFGENSAAALEEMKSAMERLNEEMNNAMDAWVEMQEQILAAEEKLAEQVEERQEQYEAIGEQLEYQKEVTELIYGEQAYAILDQIYDAQEQNNQAMIQEQRMQIEQLQAALDNLRAQGDTESELYKQMEDRLRDAQSNLQDLITNSLEIIREEYEKTVESILETWSSGALGGNDLDWMETEWELIERNSEQYLDNVNAAYETQKLQNKYIELLDNETNLHNQQLITQQMNEQLGYLREKDKLSEYDVAYANAQLEILQKRIALEEAQQNKSQMKLKRDTQGNYSYVYTADEANMAAAQSDLLDAENNAYNLSKDNMIEMQNNSMSALKDAYSLIQDIWTNANLTLEEKSDRTQKVVDALKEYLAGAAEQLSTSEENLINDFLGMTESLTDENSARLSDVFTELVGGNNDALTQIDERFRGSIVDWLKNLESFNNDCDNLMDELVGNVEEMEADIADVADAAEEDFSQISSSVEDCTNATKELTNSTAEFFDTLSDQTGIMTRYQEGLNAIKDDLGVLMEKYNQEMQSMEDKVKRLERQNMDYRAALGLDENGNPASNNPPSGNPSGGNGNNPPASSENKIGIAQAIWTYGGARSGWGNDPVRSDKITKHFGVNFAKDVQEYINAHEKDGKLVNYGSTKFFSKKLIGYDTGGYTGTWTDGDSAAKNGKLAYLHQKELVLNENDTKNLLAAVKMIRTLTDQVKNSNIAQAVSAISGKVGVQSAGDTIEQRVAIEANFPNVKDATEIEQALLNLSDQAYQWAYRYR